MNFDQFKDKAAKILNIKLDGYKIKRVKRRTDSLMRRRDVDDYRECLALIKNDLNFRRAYINHFTINTSEFYRNPKNYQHLQDKILPELLAKNNKLKIWSAPCSNGSEPYTVAIILTEMGISSSRYEILASDLDPDIISDARRGLYKENAVKDVPDSILKKYFTINDNSDKKYKLDRNIKNKVKFEKRDLIYGKYIADWDLIISRNFFIYLTKKLKGEIIKRFVSVLKKDGYLFLGNTEFIFRSDHYALQKDKYSFYKKS